MGMDNEVIVRVESIGWFFPSTLGKCAKLVNGDLESKPYGIGGDHVCLGIQAFPASGDGEDVVGICSVFQR